MLKGNGIKTKKLNIKALEKRVMLDASLGALTSTTVLAENDANTTPQILDNDVTITGTTTDFDGDALTISTTGGLEDQLTVNNEGSAAGEIGFDGTNITYGGTLVGTISSNGVNGADLVVDFNTDASRAAIERLIENVTYQNVSDDPVSNRTINFALSTYFSEDISLTIVPQNEAPTIDINTALTVNENASSAITSALLGISDPDNTDLEVTINVTSAPVNGQLELTSGVGVAISSFTLDDLNNDRVIYVHNGSQTTSDAFDFTVTDGAETTGADTFSISVNPIDDAPVIVTNNGADVSLGFSVNLGGEAEKFGVERFRESGVGTYGSNQGLIDDRNSMFTLIFTTDSINHTGNPGQVLFEDGGSGRGIGLYLNSANELVWYSGSASNTPVLSSGMSLANNTQYAVVIEVDKDSDQIRMHYRATGDFSWFSFGRGAEAQVNGYTDTNDLSGGDDGALGVPGGGSRGGYNGSVNGTQNFQGTINSDLIVYDFPTGGGTPNTKLVATDVDDTSSELIYTITDNVDYGTVFRDGVALSASSTFTQADLDSGLITYDSIVGNDDQFTFSLYDGTTLISAQTYDIRVNTVNTAPVLLSETIIYDEDFEGGTTGWNNNTTTTNGTLSEFWGRFNRNINVGGNQELFQTFSLSGSQEYITVEFDFYEIDSWDNEYFYVFIDDTQVLNNHRYHQNTHDLEAGGYNAATDTTYRVQELTDGLGWIEFNNSFRDSITTYSLTIKNTDTDFKLGFGTSLSSSNLNDESFGIDNIRIKELSTTGNDRTFQISELVPNGDQVGFAHAVEPDIGQDLSYTVTGGTGAGIFSVNSSTGEIEVTDNSSIDFESGTTSYTLTVRATDNGPGLLFDEQTYTINILDALENTSPTFTGTGPFTIAENASVNDDVGTVTTSDAEGDNVSYRIVSGNGDNIFKINATSGLIEINNTTNLDYDRDDQYTIRIRATDDNDLFKYRDQNVTINISDIDEAPLLNAEDVIETQNAGVIYSSATGNFYKLITSNKSFNDALSFAPTQVLNGVAGHGLTITSAAEFSFVDSITPTHNWLALTDQDSEGNWYWVAGPEAGTQIVKDGNTRHPAFFENWNGSEPNSGNARDFALMNSNDRWYDDWTGSYDSIVEWEGADIINNDTYIISHSNPDASDITVGTSIGFVQGVDPEGGALIYSIENGDTDNIFEIDAVTGELRIRDTTNLDAGVTDNYTLTVRVTEAIGGKIAEIDVGIVFNDALSLTTNNALDAPEGGTTPITTAELDISDIDNVAADTLFRIENRPDYGRIEISTYPGFEVSSFTYDDVQNGRVVYVHDGSQISTDSFDFSVTDGGNILSANTFNINIIDVNFGPSIDVNTGATVVEGGNVLLTQAMLDSSDPDITDTPDQLTYTISALANGHIEVGGAVSTVFTQEDINNNIVVFVHDGSESNGTFNLSLADQGEDSVSPATGTFTVIKTDVNDSPVITTNNGVTVVEGQTVTITTADLDTTDPDDSGTGLTYTLSNITNGFVELSSNPNIPIISFTQDDLDNNRVVFRHDGNEGNANFDVTVADNGEDSAMTDTATVNVNKIDVNDAPTVGINLGTSVNQNSIVVIKNSILNAADPDDSGAGLYYNITGATNGQVELISNPNIAITSFTQADIDNSQIIFRHSGPLTTASFDFILSDDGENGAGTVSDTFSMSVDNVNDAPTISTNVAPTMDEGATLVLTTAMLDSFDPDDFGTGLYWTASNLNNGIIQVGGVTQNAFTQADLDAGIVTFIHDDSETITAGFDIQVADDGEDSALPDTDTFTINVTPVNEGPTLIINDGSPNVIDFNDYIFESFDSFQDGQGGRPATATVSPDGNEVTIAGNAWKRIPLTYTLTGNTVLSFEVNTNDVSEILGVGFDDASGFGAGQVLGYQLDGIQTWSGMDQSFNSYSIGDGWVRFDIPIGQDYTGPMTQLVFVLDNDNEPLGEAKFRNVNFYESGLEVRMTEGDTLTLTNTFINSSDVDDTPAERDFTAFNIQGGHIEVNGSIQSAFTQADIDNNLVRFVHDGTDTLTAGFDLSLADGFENGTTADTGRFNIIIDADDDAPTTAINNGVTLNEGATIDLTSSEIFTTDSDTEPRKVIFDVTSLPANGRLELSSNAGVSINSFSLADIQNGLLRFVHDGGETTTDAFDFTVRDEKTTLSSDTFNITILPQNDPTILTTNTGATITESGTVTLSNAMLNTTDPDDTRAERTFTVTDISNGWIELSTNPGFPADSFTQNDISNGRVLFRHDGSGDTAASFDFSVADGLEHGATATTGTFNINVDTAVNEAPILIISDGSPTTIDFSTETIAPYDASGNGDGDNGLPTNSLVSTDGSVLTIYGNSWKKIDFPITVTPDTTITFDFRTTDSGELNTIGFDNDDNLSNALGGNSGYKLSGSQAPGDFSVAYNTYSVGDGWTRFEINVGADFTGAMTHIFFGADDDSSADNISQFRDLTIFKANPSLEVDEGGQIVITNANLNTLDTDNTASTLTYNVSNVLNGHIDVNGTIQTGFTQDDVNNNRVTFIHNGGETLGASFDVSVTDGTNITSVKTFDIDVNPLNDAAVITGDLTLNMDEGSSVTLTTTDLGGLDPDDANTDITFTASSLTNGVIEVSGAEMNSFTLQDIIDGNVVFIHDGSETTSAGFNVSLADGLENSATADTASISIVVTPVNDAPIILNLSNSNILETQMTGTVIGSLSTIDADLPGDTFTYSIVSDIDNKFALVGGDLVLNDGIDYEASTLHSVTLRTDDNNGGTFDRTFTINVIDNEAPTSLQIDNSEVEENSAEGTWVANLGAIDPNMPNDVMSYSLMANPLGMFTISGNQLLVASSAIINFESTPRIDVMIRVTDLEGNVFDQAVTIDILDIAEFTNDSYIEPETMRRTYAYEFYKIKDSCSAEGRSILQTTLSNSSLGRGDMFDGNNQILRTNTTEQIRSILGLEDSIVLPLGTVTPSSIDIQQQNVSAQGFDTASDYTNIREAIAFLKDIDSAQSTASETEMDLRQYDVNNTFVDVLTYHEQRQEKLRQALSE